LGARRAATVNTWPPDKEATSRAKPVCSVHIRLSPATFRVALTGSISCDL
jgi:hypothetical protein